MSKILIVDDDLDTCQLLDKFLSKKGYEVQTALRGRDAVEHLKKSKFDLVITDYRLPDLNGLEMLQRVQTLRPEAGVIVITGYSDVRIAVKTLKQGAYDYVTKPLYPDEILLTIEGALEKREQKNKPKPNTSEAKPKEQNSHYVVGKSFSARKTQEHIELIAPTDMSVIIIGETGTGKEFVANAIHQRSKRAGESFIAIDCGALPRELAGSELFGHIKGAFTGAISNKKGSFEMADQGTLFLDEIGNLTYENQIKLLRVLQERKIKRLGDTKDMEIDVRVIAATNEDLREVVQQGEFREDLYHRLNEFKIELSPLRERKEDIMLFAENFLQQANQKLNKSVEAFSKETTEKLKNHFWHGNLRELNNVVKRAVLLCQNDQITLDCLPEEIISPTYFSEETKGLSEEDPNKTDLKAVSENAEKLAIINTLRQTGNNKTKAAELLKIDRKTLYNKLKAYGIDL